MARIGIGGTGLGLLLHADVIAPFLVRHGSTQQKLQWLPRIASGETILALCMTERGAGSDIKNLATTAERAGDEWVINGSKVFITNAGTRHRAQHFQPSDAQTGGIAGGTMAIMQLSACSVCAALFLVGLSTAAGAEDPAWVGTFVSEEQTDAGIQKAIDAATADMNFLTRSVARGRLKKTNSLHKRIAITRQVVMIGVSFDERRPIEMPADGSLIKWTREDGEILDVSARAEEGRLVQTFKAEDGQRMNSFIAEDAERLTLEVQVTSPRLSKPLTYSVRYRRAEK